MRTIQYPETSVIDREVAAYWMPRPLGAQRRKKIDAIALTSVLIPKFARF